jgi:hypothetical protein
MSMIADTKLTDEWIKAKVAANPIRELLDKDGKPTCIFHALNRTLNAYFLKPWINKRDLSKDPQYTATMLFTPVHDLRAIYSAGIREVAKFKGVDASVLLQGLQGVTIPEKIGGLMTPFHNQGDKLPKPGFTPGCMFMNVNNKSAVPVRKFSGGQIVPVTDPADAYSGMWTVTTFQLWISPEIKEKSAPPRLCASLMGVLLFADDLPIKGGATFDADKGYAGLAQGAEEIGASAPGAAAAAFGGGMMGGMADWGIPAAGAQAQTQLSAEEIIRRQMGM